MWIWLLLTVTIYLSKISIKNPMHQCIHIMTFLCKRCNKSIKKDKQSACNCGAPYWLHCQNYRCLRAYILENIFILQKIFLSFEIYHSLIIFSGLLSKKVQAMNRIDPSLFDNSYIWAQFTLCHFSRGSINSILDEEP